RCASTRPRNWSPSGTAASCRMCSAASLHAGETSGVFFRFQRCKKRHPTSFVRPAQMITSLEIKAHVLQSGFDLCGVARADRHPKLAKLAEWIAQGRAGEMTYLAESADERRDVRETLRSARSVISVGVVYNTSTPPSSPAREPGHVAVARYARGDDYHPVLRTRLRGVLRWLADASGPGLEAVTCVDDGPVQERVYAEAAGLGWIGKNTCLINPERGSWLFLGE